MEHDWTKGILVGFHPLRMIKQCETPGGPFAQYLYHIESCDDVEQRVPYWT